MNNQFLKNYFQFSLISAMFIWAFCSLYYNFTPTYFTSVAFLAVNYYFFINYHFFSFLKRNYFLPVIFIQGTVIVTMSIFAKSTIPLFAIFTHMSFIAWKMNSRMNDSIDRLFFHDLINQTHGVTLFLNYKVGISGNMTTGEIKDILQEIKVLQSLIKDHFHFSHKNLHNVSEIVSFHRIKHELVLVINNFLPEHVSHTNITFKNSLNDERVPCLVNSPVLFRVITNLVKNISEEHSRYVEVEFSYDVFGLSFQIKNKILHLNDDYRNVLENLQKMILVNDLSKQELSTGLGLKSIYYLCEKEGGKCNFRLEGDYWITEVFLPDPILKFQKNVLKESA